MSTADAARWSESRITKAAPRRSTARARLVSPGRASIAGSYYPETHDLSRFLRSAVVEGHLARDRRLVAVGGRPAHAPRRRLGLRREWRLGPVGRAEAHARVGQEARGDEGQEEAPF